MANSNNRFGPENPHPLSTLTTELVWEGKYDDNGNRREIDVAGCAMPLQKIETIDEPRSRAEAQGKLFDTKKSHPDDIRNMLIWGDNKLVMSGLLKDFAGKIDLIYIDPPFDVGADFTMDLPLGEEKDTVEKDQSTLEMVAYRDMWGKGTDSYLHFVWERLVLLKELLAAEGTIFCHIGQNVSHLVRSLMDDVFGSNNFINQFIWKRTFAHGDSGQGAKHCGRLHDVVIAYAKGENYVWNDLFNKYDPEYTETFYKHVEPKTNRQYALASTTAPGGAGKGNPSYEFLGVTRFWRFSKNRMEEMYRQGLVVQTSPGSVPRRKLYLDEALGVPLQDIWTDIPPVQGAALESMTYATQKPEKLLERILQLATTDGALVADLFCGSGTTGAVAERLGRRWIMADLGRFAIHTSRKRLIDLQRKLHDEGKPYRAFDVYNLGRYERQWWQKEQLKGADDEHRKVVLGFYKAELLNSASSPLLHGRKGPALVHVDSIDSVFSRVELRDVARAAKEAGAKQINCLAWEFEMDLRLEAHSLQAELGIEIHLLRIPREIMEKNRKEVTFFEVATLEAEPVYQKNGKDKSVDLKLKKFLPSLAEVPERELEALEQRAIKHGFDFIDFWAVDFDYRDGEPFKHHWQAYRTRKDRSLPTVSDQEFSYEKPGKYTACVKVVDTFGCDTSITVPIEV
jgi:adenine-specific DNA-methyltransferase